MSLGELLAGSPTFSIRSDGAVIGHRELVERSDAVRNRLWQLGVRPGDRVGLRMKKTVDAVVSIFGALKAGAAYVPVDAGSPAARGAYILNDCQVKAVITDEAMREPLQAELASLSANPDFIDPKNVAPAPVVPSVRSPLDDVAYILYTSGSTGKPKGVVLSHRNALSFLDWCSTTFQPTARDVFSSHAPFHFDLSILDVFLPAKHGSRLVLINEDTGKDPLRLAATIAEERITHWYSTPSILTLLCEYGRLERYDCSALRAVLFAGEVFPVPKFRAIRERWPQARYFNLYGPTETNVCTWYEVPADGSWQNRDTFPIGRTCEPNLGRVVDEHGSEVPPGVPGELVITGPNVMQGYWNRPELTAASFVADAAGRRWYRTGDIVTAESDGGYTYRGRRDRMVKRRGYRVELGEIEAALLRHPDVREASVVATRDEDWGVRIAAFVSCHEGRSLSIIALKTHSSNQLPPYMIPDVFRKVDALPRTSTDKVDLQALASSL